MSHKMSKKARKYMRKKVQIVIQKRPRWVPLFIWHRMVGMVLGVRLDKD